jgi:carbonic anhydrase
MSIQDGMTALDRLRDGNERFVEGRSSVDWSGLPAARAAAADGQAPFAVVLTCSDSRVPTEMVFDQGIGDLFVVRVAGNVVTPEVIGSVEFAVGALGSRLVVSMGHSQCGAVGAAVDDFFTPATHSDGLAAILRGIAPSVAAVMPQTEVFRESDREAVTKQAIRENARCSARRLADSSPLLAERVREEKLLIVAADYDLSSGCVTFL